MGTALEVAAAIERLPPDEYAKLLFWLEERRAAEVDADFESAILAGRFQGLEDRATREIG